MPAPEQALLLSKNSTAEPSKENWKQWGTPAHPDRQAAQEVRVSCRGLVLGVTPSPMNQRQRLDSPAKRGKPAGE